MNLGGEGALYMLDLYSQLVGKELTDMQVVCEDGVLTCHAAILAAASKWWSQVTHPQGI